MLLSLPVELVERIVRLSLRDTVTRTSYDERQATLLAFCLVHTHLRQIAQPILLEVVRLQPRVITPGGHQYQETMHVLNPARVRLFWVNGGRSSWLGIPVQPLFARASILVELHVGGVSMMVLSSLNIPSTWSP
jgi:hypothetical protein